MGSDVRTRVAQLEHVRKTTKCQSRGDKKASQARDQSAGRDVHVHFGLEQEDADDDIDEDGKDVPPKDVQAMAVAVVVVLISIVTDSFRSCAILPLTTVYTITGGMKDSHD